MKNFITLLGLMLGAVTALPVVVSSSDKPQLPYKISNFQSTQDSKPIVGWLLTPAAISATNAKSGATVKIYQNDALVKAGKGAAWVVELSQSIDPKIASLAKPMQNLRVQQAADWDRPLRSTSKSGKSASQGTTLTGKGGGSATSVEPSQGGASIVAMTTQIGEQIGDRIGQPIGVFIGGQIGKAIGQPIGRAIGGAIGQGIAAVIPG